MENTREPAATMDLAPLEGDVEAEVDARGALCPLPVLKARKRLAALDDGALLKLRADDPAAWVDVPHFCAEQGHDLAAQREQADGELVFFIRARARPPRR